MKTDKEFLIGVYEKADILAATSDAQPNKVIDFSCFESSNQQKPMYKLLYSVGGLVATVCIVVAIAWFFNISTPMFSQGQPAKQGLQRGSINMEADSYGSMVAGLNDSYIVSEPELPVDIAKKSDIVVIAEVKKIDKSKYEKEKNSNITTNVRLNVVENIKGKLNNRFKLTVNGGYIKKSEVFSPYQAYFVKGDIVLLFLNKVGDGDDGYTLSSDMLSKYTFSHEENGDSIYCSEDGNTISMAEIKNALIND